MQITHIPDTWVIKRAGQRLYIQDDEGRNRCGVKNRTNGKPCMNAPMENGRCRLHGGVMMQGAEHPSYKDGKHARFYKQLPTRLREIYDDYSKDVELDSLTPNIAILDTRMAELIQRLEEGDYGATYQKLRKAFYKADLALRTKDMESFAGHWRDIQELIETGSKDYSLWQQIVELNERRGRMVERKHNILNKSELTISIVQFTQVLRLIEDAFVEASEKPTAIARRQHFSQKIQTILAADEN